MTSISRPLTSDQRQLYVLDTSALVADPRAPWAFPGCDVLVPLTAVEELDSLKSRPDGIGIAAQEALRAIESLRNVHTEVPASYQQLSGIDVGNDSRFYVEPNGLHLDALRELGLNTQKSDNRILAAALGQQRAGRLTTVVSNDASLRIKAALLGLAATEHHPVSAAAETPPGWCTREVDAEVIDTLYETGSVPVDDLYELGVDVGTDAGTEAEYLTPGEFLVLRAGQSASVIARLHHDGQVRRVRDVAPVWDLKPRSKEQRMALSLLLDPDVEVVALEGSAGTGKTILALAAGLEQVMEQNKFTRVAVFRPVVSVGHADLGFLPGTIEEKLDPWFAAILDTLTALSNADEATAKRTLDELLRTRRLTQEAIGHLRGRTLVNTFVLVDEAQNLDPLTLRTLLTRLGQGSKIVFTGDCSQIDATYLTKRSNALAVLRDRFRGQECYGGLRLTTVERSHVAELASKLL
jgi:PhoH-like ATPase